MAPTEQETEGEHGNEPERTCAVCRAKLSPDDLIRFVRGPDGSIFPDVGNKLPGRGVWVACRRDSVEEARRRNVFAKSLKSPVTVPDQLADAVEDLLKRRVLGALSLANKAGLLVAGFTKVEKAIDKGGAVALVHASDAAEDGQSKLDRKFRTMLAETNAKFEGKIITDLTNSELSLAMGRLHVVHAALTKGGATKSFLKAAERLRRYRTAWDVEAARPRELGSDTVQA